MTQTWVFCDSWPFQGWSDVTWPPYDKTIQVTDGRNWQVIQATWPNFTPPNVGGHLCHLWRGQRGHLCHPKKGTSYAAFPTYTPEKKTEENRWLENPTRNFWCYSPREQMNMFQKVCRRFLYPSLWSSFIFRKLDQFGGWLTSWWFQPIWKILVKLGIFHK